MQGVGLIERAFDIAPECRSIDELKKRLVSEGYANVEAHFTGMQIKRDLASRLKKSGTPGL